MSKQKTTAAPKTSALPSLDLKYILRITGVLLVICLITALLLGIVNAVTKPRIDAIQAEAEEDPVEHLKKEFEPAGIQVFPISAVTGKGLKELLYHVQELLAATDQKPIVFEQEYFPEEMLIDETLPYTVEKSAQEPGVFLVEGPRIEKMLGYTNLDSEKGFVFFQNFLKDTGILKDLEAAGIQEGDTVKMYGLAFEYFR